MAYTAIPTYTTGDLITAAHGNTYWRDNIAYLKENQEVKKTIYIHIVDADVSLVAGDAAAYIFIPDALDGLIIKKADAAVVTPSTSGTPIIQIYSNYHSADVLSTRITIDANEQTSFTAAAASSINTARDDLHKGYYLRVDIDNAGTGTKGLVVMLEVEES